MGRYQSGEGATSMQQEPAFLVRYDASEIVVGKVTRVQRSYCLCDQDDKYHSRWKSGTLAPRLGGEGVGLQPPVPPLGLKGRRVLR